MSAVDVDPDGRFARAGMREGFIILSINGERISKPEQVTAMFKAIVKSSDEKVMFISGVYPSGKAAYYAVPLTD